MPKIRIFSENSSPAMSSDKPKSSKISFASNVKKIFNTSMSSNCEKTVPKIIHHFWQGDIKSLDKHLANLEKVATTNPSYKTQLHLLSRDSGDCKRVQEKLQNVHVIDLSKEKWFLEFQKTERFKQFQASRSGERKHLASGADIFKSELLARKGGVWNDVDNPPVKPLPNKLTVSKGDVLTAGPVVFKRWGGEKGVHSSTLATHRNNKNLEKVNRSSFEKFQSMQHVIYKKNSQTDNRDNHFKMVSETAGSLHLSRELFKQSPSMVKEVDSLLEQGKKFGGSKIIMDEFFKPTSTTGAGELDEEQAKKLLAMMSDPGHVII
ncbi:glycosyltransferase family 32 protein [Vibrio sp. VNB-15]